MKFFLFLSVLFIRAISCGSDLSEYWLLEQDFIKIGKRDLYEVQKPLELKAGGYSVIGMADLENPQFMFLMPIKNLGSLSKYPPFTQPLKDSLVPACLNFHIFSLHRLLKTCSLRPEDVFVPTKPYCLYAIYEVEPESAGAFEESVAKKVAVQEVKVTCGLWKGLLAGEYPKYIFCASFATKEEMTDWSLEKVIDEAELKSILRGKKTGMMKRQKEFCLP